MGKFAARALTLSVMICLVMIAPAFAQLPMTGEHFIGETFEVTNGKQTLPFFRCSELTGKVVQQLIVGGPAVGPYPGIFAETLRLTRPPDTADTAVDTTFTIDSPAGAVSGLKRGAATAECTVVVDPLDPKHVLSEHYDLVGTIMYTAEITTPTGEVIQDEGTSVIQLISNLVDADGDGEFDRQTFLFNESFTSLQAVTVILEPAVAVNPAGTPHTVNATVLVNAQPAAGIVVNFTIGGTVNTQTQCTTDVNGQCSITFMGPNQPDVVPITGCVGGGTTCGMAEKVYIMPASTPGKVTGGGYVLENGQISGISFGFNAQFEMGRFRGQGVVIDHIMQTQVKILDVDFLLIAGTHAMFRGNANINGTPTRYTIDVDDLGEPGALRDTFKIVTETGYVAAGLLTRGNIQIHP